MSSQDRSKVPEGVPGNPTLDEYWEWRDRMGEAWDAAIAAIKADPNHPLRRLRDREEEMNAAPTTEEMEAEEDNRLYGESWFPPKHKSYVEPT